MTERPICDKRGVMTDEDPMGPGEEYEDRGLAQSLLREEEMKSVLLRAGQKYDATEPKPPGVLCLFEDCEGRIETKMLPEVASTYHEPIQGFRNPVTTTDEIYLESPAEITYRRTATREKDGVVSVAYYVEVWRG